MANRKSKQVANALVVALVYVVIGILFCVFKREIANWIVYAVGILLIVQGVLDMVSRRLVQGILEAVVGILCIVFARDIVEIAMIVFGVILLLWAVLRLFDNSRKTALTLLYIVFAAVIGVLMIISHFRVLDWFFILIGVLLIVEGILCLLPASARK